MIERKIRWNRVTDPGEQVRMRHTYFFAILNDPREIMRIRQRITERVPHVDDFEELGDFGVSGSNGLHCQIFSFTTDTEELPPSREIYQGDFRRDRNLYSRKKGDWGPYFESLVKS